MVEPDELARATKPSDRVMIGWRRQAACRGMDPAIWYPHPDAVKKPWAIAICALCPVRQRCLDHALQRRERLGIWGGKTAGQRRAILARRALGD